jgi:hypothetical protein
VFKKNVMVYHVKGCRHIKKSKEGDMRRRALIKMQNGYVDSKVNTFEQTSKST